MDTVELVPGYFEDRILYRLIQVLEDHPFIKKLFYVLTVGMSCLIIYTIVILILERKISTLE